MLYTTQAALLVDESNAFNNLNCQLALANIAFICHAFSCILINTYRNHANLFGYFITGRNNSGLSLDHGHVCIDTYPSIRHNEIRNTSAQSMSEVCPNVAAQPTLQPVTNEHFFHYSDNTESGAHLHVRAQGFWGIHGQQAYFESF